MGLRVGNLAVELAQSYESAGGVSPRNLNEIKCLRLIRWLLAWLQSPGATHCTVAANNIARSGGRGRELAFCDNLIKSDGYDVFRRLFPIPKGQFKRRDFRSSLNLICYNTRRDPLVRVCSCDV